MLIRVIFFCCLFSHFLSCQSEIKSKRTYNVNKTDKEWKKELTYLEYYVLRKEGTEPAFSSSYNKFYKQGTYVCAACENPLFESENKFDSGTGWPSFDQEIDGNVGFSTDYNLGYLKTEEHCDNCGGHLGHMFNDGPKLTTGERHCINGAALKFIPKNER